MRIYLIGFMGCGKSSFGKRLAKKLAYPFLDLDEAVESESGLTVPELFSMKGETAFRELEKEVLHKTLEIPRGIIATGGGTPCFYDNMEFMKASGKTVYLKMNPLSLAHRLEYARRERPMVSGYKGEELLELIKTRLKERENYYLQAHCIIKGETVKPDQVISLVFGQ
ncbi:MAG: shikimate kinase [Bacteroidales bacterium]